MARLLAPTHRMNDSQILSTLQGNPRTLPGPLPAPQADALLFDVCHGGMALRAVLVVEGVVAVMVLFGAAGWVDWLLRLAMVTSATVPATALWLVAVCAGKRLLARQSATAQCVAGMVLGALCGLYGCAQLYLIDLVPSAPWVASALAGAMLAALLVAALVWRLKGRTPAATAARLSELQSRIRPHFLFNTLNTAIALVRDQPAQAERVLEDLAELFRHALAEQGDAVPLAQEITLAERYLEIEQARFGERLRVTWALDPAAGSARVPPLLLQPLVENAVKHGVEPSASGADIRISTRRQGSLVLLKVTNTVPAGQGARGHGVALANVRDRLHLLHDVHCSFQAALVDGTYQVRIQVPLPPSTPSFSRSSRA